MEKRKDRLEDLVGERTRQLETANVQLWESEERFRLLVEGAKDHAIIMLDPDGRVVSWNSGAEATKGYTASEIIGHHISCFYVRARPSRWPPTPCIHDEAVAILHQQIAAVAQLGLFAIALARQLRLWIGRRFMRPVRPLLAMKVHRRIAGIVIAQRRIPSVLPLIALESPPMGRWVNGRAMNVLGWLTTAAMFAATIGLVVTMLK